MPSGDQELKGTSAIITGGGRGLGRVMTKALVTAGASVLVVDIDDDPINEVLANVPGEIFGQQADISREADIAAIMTRASELFGHLDVIINNAGINLHTMGDSDTSTLTPTFYEVGPRTVQRFFDVHVLGPFLLSRAAVGGMLDQGFGRIITVTTGLRHMTQRGSAPYGPMKAASEAFSSVMAQKLKGTEVTVNVLHPGGAAKTRFVRTPGSGRVEPEVMGPPAVWLASRASDGINGRRFTADQWDPSLPSATAATISSTPIAWPVDWSQG